MLSSNLIFNWYDNNNIESVKVQAKNPPWNANNQRTIYANF
jgi:hypothetical protein